MTREDKEYFLSRAAEERKKATESQSGSVAAIHIEMAESYEQHFTETTEEPDKMRAA